MDKLRTCFFTGHRRIAAGRAEEVKKKTAESIERLIIEYDVKDFIDGGALGFDMIAAEAVIELKKKYPHIRLHLYLPCYGQSKRWNDNQKYRYRMIMSRADESVYITEKEYSEGCMMQRNMKMIEDSFFCISFCIMHASGTGATLRNAENAGRKIINIADDIYKKH